MISDWIDCRSNIPAGIDGARIQRGIEAARARRAAARGRPTTSCSRILAPLAACREAPRLGWYSVRTGLPKFVSTSV